MHLVLIVFFSLIIITTGHAQQKKKSLDMEDLLAWKNIRSTAVSDDGKWFACLISPNEGDSELLIKEIDGKKEYKFRVGQSRSGRPTFSSDSNWCAFTVSVKQKEAKKLKKQKKKIYNSAYLVELATGDKTAFEKVKRFTFSEENAAWLALHKYPAESQGKWKGTDLILYELATKKALNIGNVAEYAFNKKGRFLAWIVDASEKSCNGVQLRDLNANSVISLDNGKAQYKSLSWTEEGDGLCILKGEEDDDYKEDIYSLVGFTGFLNSLKTTEYNPKKDKTFPEGMSISPNRRPVWTDDLSGILFGIHEVEKKEKKDNDKEKAKDKTEKSLKKNKDDKKVVKSDKSPQKVDSVKKEGKVDKKISADKEIKKPGDKKSADKDDGDVAGLVIWHYKDKRLQSMQQVQESRDKKYSYLSIYRVREKKFIRLADDDLRDVTAAPKQKWAVGIDDREYKRQTYLSGVRHRDIYVINLETGERKLALKKHEYYLGVSPDGTHFLYYDDGHYFTYDMAACRSYNITADIPSSFIDEDNDENLIKPPTSPVGWAKGGGSVLLYDNWDIWKAPVHGGVGVNLTVNGKEKQLHYSRRLRLDPDEKGIDLTAPIYFTVLEQWTKKGGIARIDSGAPGARMLLFEDAAFSRVLKAKKADRFIYSRSTSVDFPDYYATDCTFQMSHKITEANPQQKEFTWSSGAMLVDYESKMGDKLQAALYLPADYEKGKSYPTIVYIYEKLSHRLNSYSSPSARGFNRSIYTSCGYAVMTPDITYKINDPGMSALWCVVPAIEAAAKLGVVDIKNVAIHGHSWGGYQAAFLITQTDLFKAAVAGAALTNMVSMYSSIYWNTGSANQPIFESAQGRFDGGYFENIEAYTRNSPVYYAKNVKTPLLILHNDDDGAVDWNQGIEYFNTLRRLNKPVVMLQYKGENHGLRKKENQKDYYLRMREFLDHHLKGAKAPKWLEEGIPLLDMEKHLKDRLKLQKFKTDVDLKDEKKEEKKVKSEPPAADK